MKSCQMLTLDDARMIAVAAENEARRRGWPVTIAICDAGGHPLLLQRMDGAPLMSTEVAPAKARTCVMTRKPSQALEDMINNGRYAALKLPVATIGGGEMIVVGGELVGGVGVSGAKPDEDAVVARAGVAAIGASVSL